MNTSIPHMIDIAERLRAEDEPINSYTYELGDITDPQEALDLYRRATVRHQAAGAVRKATGERLAQLLGEGGVACYGTNIVRYKLGKTEKCIDPAKARAAFTHIAHEGENVGRWINPNNLLKTGMSKAYRDTFYHKVDDDEPKLTDIPIDEAPLYLQHMVDGDVRIKEDTT